MDKRDILKSVYEDFFGIEKLARENERIAQELEEMNSKYKRIDGCVALIIAYAVLNRYKNDYTNMSS